MTIIPLAVGLSVTGKKPVSANRLPVPKSVLTSLVVINPEHVLHQFLTEREQTYNLRRRPHGSKTLLTKTQSLNELDFFIGAMYKHGY